ncbi:MAG TPA: arylsulfatase [Selenomonas sp.]|nr:LTA synthase family protein [Selenomonadaceae bacterium]HCB94094.1 arylsulfatase [Selenomonas sp.]
MRLEKFYGNIQQDLKLFIFILCILCCYRAWFMWQMSGFMGEGVDSSEIAMAMWAGMRLSLKSAGAAALLAFVLSTIPNLVFPKPDLDRVKLFVGTIVSFILSVLFQARFPYYREFHMTFNMQVLQGANDDVVSIFWMAVEEYGFFWRFAIAVLLTLICWKLLKKLLSLGTFALPGFSTGKGRALFSVGLVVVIFLFSLFVRFGGSFSYAKGINWENAGVTGDEFLNECILDDFQALYRVRSIGKKMQSGKISGVRPERIREYAKSIAGNDSVEADDLKPYLERRAKGAKLPKPRHIFIILGETWMQWPLLEDYKSLHIADGLKGIIEGPDAYYSRAFMPNGDFTSIAITGLVTGLSEVNIRANYQPRTFEEPYPTAMAEAFHGLGYKVDFWYGGIPSWDSINRMSTAQGFDNFYGYPDFHGPKQSTWGTTDRALFEALEKHLAEEPPTVHLIMTVSNHPPYNLDLEAEGFDMKQEIQEVSKLPYVEDAEELARELGHYWYMDKCAAEFVKRVKEKYPDSLFVITGDHAVRSNPGTRPTMFEHQTVPFVLCGQGVTKDIMSKDAVGGHTSITPTLVELIAPEGFSYYSIASSMTESTGIAFNRDYWLTREVMGAVDLDRTEYLPGIAAANEAAARERLEEVMPGMRTISWWLLEKGTSLKDEEK